MPTNYTTEIQNAITQNVNNGVGLYNALKSIHYTAKQAGDAVIYPSHETLYITIPNNPQKIQLSHYTDFNSCKFIVTNTSCETDLFVLTPVDIYDPNSDNLPTVNIDGSQLKKNGVVGGVSSTPKLVLVEDQNEWTYRNDLDPIKRKDVFFVNNNLIQNDPIASYDNYESVPICRYLDATTVQKVFKDIEFERTGNSTKVTNLLSVRKYYNVLIQEVTIVTPDQGEPGPNPDVPPIYKDACININDSAKIEMKDIIIDYTYSSDYFYGYGIRLLNVWDSYILRLTANSPRKGVMGNDNVNGLIVENSFLNRVDVHCYGRDITCTNCTFNNNSSQMHIYNRVSSFFGKLTFINCTFDRFLPLRIDSAYNAFTPFDLILDNCTLNVTTSYKSIVNTEELGSINTTRTEVQTKCLPNIIITNLHLNFLQATEFYFIEIYNYGYAGNIHYMNTFVVDVVEVTQASPNPVTIYDFCYTDHVHINSPLNLVEPLRRNINMIRHIVGGS